MSDVSRTPGASPPAPVVQPFRRLPVSVFEEIPSAGASPAHYLRAVLSKLHLSQAQLAARTGLSTKHVNQVTQGLVPLTPETALLLQRALGVPSEVWNALEAAHQDSAVKVRSLEQAKQWAPWLKRFPVKDLEQRGVLDPTADTATKVGQLLSFFQVADPDAYDRVWEKPVASGFRRAKNLTVDTDATAAWLRLAETAADALEIADYQPGAFATLLPRLRRLTKVEDDREAVAQLQQACARVGVAVVVVREIKGSRACGAARWLNPAHPMIVLSGRYGKHDSVWFTFFHEAAHIVHHSKRETYIHLDKRGDDADGLEVEADQAAVRYLVGARADGRLRAGLKYDEVRAIADEAGVDVGIVAGQLSYRFGEYQKYARLRRPFEVSDD